MNHYAIANWKMNLPPEGIDRYLDELRPVRGMVISPPFPWLREVAARFAVAGQNCGDQKSGAFTGEVAPSMLRECGAAFVIIGHSERRRVFGESNELIARKLAVAIDEDLTPIFCVGEDQQVRDAGGAARHVCAQISAARSPALDAAKEIVVAYEPLWAIGTGQNATGETVAEMVAEIRVALHQYWPEAIARTAPILYGGSVTPDNIEDIGGKGRIAGYLVGGASLDSAKFNAICAGLARLRPA